MSWRRTHFIAYQESFPAPDLLDMDMFNSISVDIYMSCILLSTWSQLSGHVFTKVRYGNLCRSHV